MHVQLLTKDQEEAYTEFLLSQSTSLFYHSIKYKNFLEGLLGCESYYLLALDEGKIIGALPLMVKDGPLGKVMNSLPYYGSHGGLLGCDLPKEAIELLKIEFNRIDIDCASSTLISMPTHNNIEFLRNSVTDRRISQITPLDPCANNKEEYILSIIESSTKRNINKAKRSGVNVFVKNAQALSFLEKTHKENMNVIGGKAKSQKFFENIIYHFHENYDYKIYVAEKDGIDIAALLVFYFNKTVEYFTPVIDYKYRDQQSLALIIYEAMIDSMNEGHKAWNWGGTWLTQSGVYQFKKKWGALEKIYNYSTCIKNKEILKAKSHFLTESYDGFYVCNFNKNELLQ